MAVIENFCFGYTICHLEALSEMTFDHSKKKLFFIVFPCFEEMKERKLKEKIERKADNLLC